MSFFGQDSETLTGFSDTPRPQLEWSEQRHSEFPNIAVKDWAKGASRDSSSNEWS
jgi:hypothetical protein